MTDLRLRPATQLDAGRIGAILSGWIDETDWMPRIHTRAEDIAHAEMLVTRNWVTVATRADQVVGFLARDGEEVHALYVAAPERGTRVGTTLLEAAKARSPELGLWTFQSNTAAQAFYERHGFVEVARTDGAENDEGLPDLRYVWTKGNTP